MIIIIYSLRVFHISVSWWTFTWVWGTANLLKSPGTLLGILTVLNNIVVWMVSTHPLIYKSPSSFNNPLVTVLRSTNHTLYNFHFHGVQFFSIPNQGFDTYTTFYFLSVLLCGQPEQQSPQFFSFSFLCCFVYCYKVWSSGRD